MTDREAAVMTRTRGAIAESKTGAIKALFLAAAVSITVVATAAPAAHHASRNNRVPHAVPPAPAIKEAQSRVRAALKDPDSARFGEARLLPNGAVCGMVNAKNSYGGYSGSEMYGVSRTGEVLIASEEPSGTDERLAWMNETQKLLDLCKDSEIDGETPVPGKAVTAPTQPPP